MTVRTLLLLVLAALALGGCGEGDVERVRDDVERRFEERVAEARREFQERRERFGRRIDEILAGLEQAVPEARETNPRVRSRGDTEAQTIDGFLGRVIEQVDTYWERTFATANLPQPRVGFVTVPPGQTLRTACGAPAGDSAAFYCPADDTIYIAQVFASELYQGVARGLPGEQAGYGRAAGDFAVAYVVAHEYAHNLQQELGVFDNRESPTARPFELQADCLSGAWANSQYEQGLIDDADIAEATGAALAVGDFDVGNAQHHGTPEERRDALLAGFETGEPARCNAFVPGGDAGA